MWLFKGLWVRFRLWLLVVAGLGRLGWDPLGLGLLVVAGGAAGLGLSDVVAGGVAPLD